MLCATFVVIAPTAWRLASAARSPAALILYGATGAAIVLSIGWVMPRVLDMPRSFLTTNTSLAIEIALFWVGGWGLGRAIDLETKLDHERQRAAQLERQAEHARLLAMRAHLDPHFLFNTLNAIAEWCRHDAHTAEAGVLELASLLRAILPAVRSPRWPLDRELALVESLWSLHRMRDPSRFDVQMHLPADLPDTGVPALLLLPLAENAMTHGPCAGHRGPVTLRIVADDGCLRIEIENPGAYQPAKTNGSGLATVRERLALTYGDRARFSIGPFGERTRVRLTLPIEEEQR
jgi:LytS/YehU family sensor histidine kinase